MDKIIIYTTKNCSYCHRAKILLTSKKVKFTEINIDDNSSMRQEMIKHSGRTTVPQIFINGQHIGGCDDLYKIDKLGNLDILLNLRN